MPGQDPRTVAVSDWFLSAHERRNPATRLDERHPDDAAWSPGNAAKALVHGATYFAELSDRLAQLRGGDLVLFADWRGDPDQQMTPEPDSAISKALCDAAPPRPARPPAGGRGSPA